ncbi:MAG: hypothetical protein GY679_00150 [Mycoplasma sp.]|nr:hypothetical protein [Mycoplasma sp.]
MNATDYIKTKLKEIASKFNEAKIRYEHRVTTQSHLIEIVPLTFFENDEAYIIEEAAFEDEFEQLFPDENIVFISENSLTQINKSEFDLGYNHFVFDLKRKHHD